MNRQSIVLAADLRFSEQLMTTIKSICLYNKNLNFFIFNREFSYEWFQYLNTFLEKINCEVIDVKINNDALRRYPTLAHISSESTYFRYFVSEFINDDKVLYLDSDLVVNGSLQALFDLDLGDNFVAASLDDIAQNIYNTVNNFNAGVLLINNKLWKEYQIHQKALELTEKCVHQVPDGDQGILNILFNGKWLQLSHNVNYLVGGEYIYYKNGLLHFIQRRENEIPLVLHFNTAYKPWLPIYNLPFRNHYWFYYRLTWEEIISQHG
ncbi:MULTISPECIES: glycosyltransferase family 8 protein [Glaesserella]|uniref:Glycosyltransferase family 8 protein n=1 Tax=Glaesserella australis TaxID=2094024 RepID=A0A328BXS4_9PAST|nr:MULTISPECIES: glycosyltransferase family 8 protein [Glaesserella]AUI66033.1 glycosyl transferase [Glaesserella sp. 15-184]RAL18247.1 glycosyltransferase family 8 protein [Glaesserella australis]